MSPLLICLNDNLRKSTACVLADKRLIEVTKCHHSLDSEDLTMTTWYVATFNHYVLVDAADELEARELALPGLRLATSLVPNALPSAT